MVNFNNLFAGLAGFIGGLAITYATFPAVTSFVTNFSDEVQPVIWASIILFYSVIMIVIPLALSTADDKGSSI